LNKNMSFPKISIIILNWNGFLDTSECLKSVEQIEYSNYEIVVVDNGSSDGSTEKIRKQFPAVILLCNKENLGFAEGNNVGIRFALKNQADYILLLNNDTIVDSKILNSFLKSIKNNLCAGVFGAKIYYFFEPNRIWFAGGVWARRRANFLHLGMGEIDVPEKFNKTMSVDYVCGCALFAKREVFDKCGLLDPRFFLMFEDADWCTSAREAGYNVIFVPEAKVWHKISVSFGGTKSPYKAYFKVRNRLLFSFKHLKLWERIKSNILVLADFFPGLFYDRDYHFFKSLWLNLKFYCDFPEIFIARLRGVIDYNCGHFGDSPAFIKKSRIEIK